MGRGGLSGAPRPCDCKRLQVEYSAPGRCNNIRLSIKEEGLPSLTNDILLGYVPDDSRHKNSCILFLREFSYIYIIVSNAWDKLPDVFSRKAKLE